MLREIYQYNETYQGRVPKAIRCFMKTKDFEDANKGRTDVLTRFDPY